MPMLTSSPRVVGKNRADFYNLRTLLDSPQFVGKTGEDLVLALYNYFTSQVDGNYHYWDSNENEGSPRTRGRVTDALKLINVYGWLICGQVAHFLMALYEEAGLPCREYGVPGHNLCEVNFEGRWHHVDVDMWTWFRTSEGYIASASELQRSPEKLILQNANRSNPCNLPDRSLEGYTEMYAKAEMEGDAPKHLAPHWVTHAHTMDFRLRPGETLIRSQTHQGRFPMPESWRKYLERHSKEWVGFPRERFEPFRTFGNGKLVYQPNLSKEFADFQAGVWDSTDLTQTETGLLGPGKATIRVQSPYVFTGIPDFTNPFTHRDGMWIEAAGQGDVRIEVQDAEGRWGAVIDEHGSFERRVDITRLLQSRYDGLIRLTLGPKAHLSHFKFEGYLLTAPISLPRLEAGSNEMELRTLDKHHQCTVPWKQTIDFRATADLPAQWVSVENATLGTKTAGWQTIAPKDPAAGPVRAVFRFDLPDDRKFAWAYALASLNEIAPNEPRKSATFEWSPDARQWLPFATTAITNTRLQWDCSLDGEFRPDSPLKTIYLRLTSGTAICALEFVGHVIDQPNAADELHITHRWQEGDNLGAAHSFDAPPGKTRYSFTCGKDPAGHTIEMRVPSRRRQKA